MAFRCEYTQFEKSVILVLVAMQPGELKLIYSSKLGISWLFQALVWFYLTRQTTRLIFVCVLCSFKRPTSADKSRAFARNRTSLSIGTWRVGYNLRMHICLGTNNVVAHSLCFAREISYAAQKYFH